MLGEKDEEMNEGFSPTNDDGLQVNDEGHRGLLESSLPIQTAC